MKKMKLFICGFSGSGKSHLLKRLKESSGNESVVKFLDLDSFIEESAEKSIREIVESEGWDSFRKKETAAIALALKESGQMIVALGGGGLSKENYSLIKFATAKMLWLDVAFETCFQRIEKSKNRPLVEVGRDELYKIYEERKELFELADFRLKGARLNPDFTFDDLKKFLDEESRNRHT